MNKYILGIDGMRCGMCEMHVEEAIKKVISAKRVAASHINKNVVIITEENLDEYDFEKALKETGYRITSFKRDVPVKRWYGWR